MCEWFLGVDVDATFHRHLGCREVRVIRCADDNGIDLLMHFVQHFAEVIKKWLIRPPLLHVLGTLVMVDITECDEVLLRAALIVRLLSNPSSRTDKRNIQLVIRRFPWLTYSKCGPARIGCPKEITHRLTHRIPDEIVRLSIGIPVVTLPGWRLFLRPPEIACSDEGHIAVKLRILCDRGLRLHE